jgi:hypothetical protein
VAGKTIADGYLELRIDDSKLDGDTKAKVAKVANTFGNRLNKELGALSIDPIDLQANPRDAIRSVEELQEKLREASREAPTVEMRIKTERALGQLAAFRKQLGDAGDDPEPAKIFTTKFEQRLAPLLSKLSMASPIATAAGAAGAAAAPLLGAAIAGGILGGAGIGGVAGGFLLASKDGRVKAAEKSLADSLQDRLEEAAGSFIQPALNGIGRIDAALGTIDFNRIFADSSRYVDELAGSAGNSITTFGDALETLVSNAGPVVTVIGQGIEQVVASLSQGLTSISDDGESAATSLETIFNVISQGVTVTFQLVNLLTELYGISKKIGADTGLQLLLKATGQTMDETGESARKTGEGAFGMGNKFEIAADQADQLKAANEQLKPAQDAVAAAQKALAFTLDTLSSKNSKAKLTADSLKSAYDNLFGATINQTEANEAYQESFDRLSETVKANAKEFKHSRDNLDLHSRAGRSNRDVLQDLLQKSNDLYIADIAAGKSVAYATEKHEKRTTQVRKEAREVRLNKAETEKLITTYGSIPPSRTTDIVLDKVDDVVEELKKLYTIQRALALGININLVTGTGTVKNFKAAGGAIRGEGTGTSDDVPVMASHGEHMWTAAEVRAAGGHSAMEAMRSMVLHRAKGGPILTPVDTSRRWPFVTSLANTDIPTREEVEAKVAPVFGDWPSSPGAQRGDSGVWRRVVALIKSGPKSGSFGNAYRPGDPLWHGSGRAVDWMGFNQDALATFLAAKKPLELIHRTKRRDYAYTRGRNKGSFNNGLMEAHRNHIHIAMDDGGFRMLQPGINIIPNGTGRPEPIAGPAGMAAIASNGGMDVEALVAELRAVRLAVEQNGDVVGRHVRRGIGGVDANLGMAADLYSRTA